MSNYYNKTIALPARPRSSKLREAGYSAVAQSSGASQVIVVDAELSEDSTNPVQNRAIYNAVIPHTTDYDNPHQITFEKLIDSERKLKLMRLIDDITIVETQNSEIDYFYLRHTFASGGNVVAYSDGQQGSGGGGGVNYLYMLEDVPDYRTSYRGKYLRAKSDGSGVEWVDVTGGVSSVISLTGDITQSQLRTALGLGSLAYLNGLSKGDVGLGNVENTALSTWAGTSNITTLGTITTGVWHGSAIANSYLANSKITIAGSAVSLGGSITANTIVGAATSAATFAGTAAVASKVGTSTVGASNRPVYINGGVPTVCSPGEAFLAWGGKNFSNSYGPIDSAMVPALSANRSAFLKPAGVVIEYSRDSGATWIDYGASDATKIGLFSGIDQNICIGKADSSHKATASYKLRITIRTSAAQIYTTLNKFVILLSTEGSTGCTCSIDARLQSNYESGTETWVNFANKVAVSGWSGYNVINTSSLTTYGNTKASQYGEVRFTFEATGGSETYNGLRVIRIYCFGGVGWTTPSTMARTGNIFSYDASQNVTFPANLTISGTAKVGSNTIYHSGNLTAATLGAETTAHAASTYQPLATAINTGNIASQSVNNATLHDGYTITQTNGLTNTIRNFVSGTLVKTSIDYSVTNGDSFYVEIKGNTYSDARNSCFTQVQGYIYSDTIRSYGVTHLGVLKITPITAMNLNGKLCFWFPRLGYWMGFDIRCYRGTNYAINTVTSIGDSSDPGGTKRVVLTEQEITSWHSGNCNNTSTPWSASSLTLNGAISGATKLDFNGKTTDEIGLEVKTVNGVRYLHTTLPFYSDNEITAWGVGSGGGGGAAVWGGITGTLSNQTDLMVALNGKQATLTFDQTPTPQSTNPVTSGGIDRALDRLNDYINEKTTVRFVDTSWTYDEIWSDYQDGCDFIFEGSDGRLLRPSEITTTRASFVAIEGEYIYYATCDTNGWHQGSSQIAYAPQSADEGEIVTTDGDGYLHGSGHFVDDFAINSARGQSELTLEYQDSITLYSYRQITIEIDRDVEGGDIDILAGHGDVNISGNSVKVNGVAITPNGYVTAVSTNGDYLTYTKGGVTYNVTVPYATKAQTLNCNAITSGTIDNQGLEYQKVKWYSYIAKSVIDASSKKFAANNHANGILSLCTYPLENASYYHRLAFSGNGRLYHQAISAGTAGDWKEIINADDAQTIYGTKTFTGDIVLNGGRILDDVNDNAIFAGHGVLMIGDNRGWSHSHQVQIYAQQFDIYSFNEGSATTKTAISAYRGSVGIGGISDSDYALKVTGEQYNTASILAHTDIIANRYLKARGNKVVIGSDASGCTLEWDDTNNILRLTNNATGQAATFVAA